MNAGRSGLHASPGYGGPGAEPPDSKTAKPSSWPEASGQEGGDEVATAPQEMSRPSRASEESAAGAAAGLIPPT